MAVIVSVEDPGTKTISGAGTSSKLCVAATTRTPLPVGTGPTDRSLVGGHEPGPVAAIGFPLALQDSGGRVEYLEGAHEVQSQGIGEKQVLDGVVHDGALSQMILTPIYTGAPKWQQ
jgi:hypothetical protein